MNIFESVKQNVSVPDYACRIGIKLARGNMTRCIFHDDRTPSLKLNDTYYYCFGCGASGDVINLAAKTHGINNFEAAKMIAEEYSISDYSTSDRVSFKQKEKLNTVIKKIHPYTEDFKDKEIYCVRVICSLLHIYEDWKNFYAPKDADEPVHPRFVEALTYHSYLEHLADSLIHPDEKVRRQTIEYLYKHDFIYQIDEYVYELYMED